MQTFKVLALAAILATVAIFAPEAARGYGRVSRFLAMDSCLDHGGRFDYARSECSYK